MVAHSNRLCSSWGKSVGTQVSHLRGVQVIMGDTESHELTIIDDVRMAAR